MFPESREQFLKLRVDVLYEKDQIREQQFRVKI